MLGCLPLVLLPGLRLAAVLACRSRAGSSAHSSSDTVLKATPIALGMAMKNQSLRACRGPVPSAAHTHTQLHTHQYVTVCQN